MDDRSGWTQARWCSELCKHFFKEVHAHEPVMFAVDREALALITGTPEHEAVASLSGVVRREVMPGYRFWRVQQLTRSWRSNGCDGPPPSLPLLGLCVLAASEMEGPNYYRPFRRLLHPEDPDVDGGIPGDYGDVIPQLWSELRWWLDDHLQGARGSSTIETHEHFGNIGFALSQAIIRTSDRARLYRFFRSIRLEPRTDLSEVDVEYLRRSLAIWSSRLGAGGARLHRLATDESVKHLSSQLLGKLAAKWDGSLRDPRSGTRAQELALMLELPRVDLCFVALCEEAGPAGIAIELPGGSTEHLSSSGTYYEPVPIPAEVHGELLLGGLELSSATGGFIFEGGSAIALRYHDDLYDWVSTSTVSYGEKHHLLIHRSARDEVLGWIAAEGLDGALDPLATPKLPLDWFLIRGFRINARPSAEPPHAVQHLLGAERSRVGLHFVGGLKLPPTRTYLTGGTPHIAIPTEARGSTFTIENDEGNAIERHADGHEFQLGLFDLPEGEYTLRHGGSALRFALVDRLRDAPARSVGSVCTSSGGSSIAGLLVPDADEGRSTMVVDGCDGLLVLLASEPVVSRAVIPRWLEGLAGPMSWASIDIWLPPGVHPAWIVRFGPSGAVAECADLLPPAEEAPRTEWASLIRMATLHGSASDVEKEMWERYRAAAGIGGGRGR